MRRFSWYAAVCGGLLILVGPFILWNSQTSFPTNEHPTVQIGGQVVRVDIANTPEMREHGLSGRAGLADGEGMLFVFPEDGPHAFWMKDMRFPIDIVWLSHEWEVVDITSHVSPDTYPTAFSPQTPARYVLELPAGFIEEHAIEIGDEAVF